MTNQLNKPLRHSEFEATTGLSKSTIYNRIAAGAFPNHIPISPRILVWVKSDIKNWTAEQVSAVRRQPPFLCLLFDGSDLQPLQVPYRCFKRVSTLRQGLGAQFCPVVEVMFFDVFD